MSNLPVPIGGTALPSAELADALHSAAASAAAYMQADTAAATQRAYASDWSDFETWCDAHGLAALPAGPSAVAAYLAALADRGLKASTVGRRVAAIGYRHKRARQPDPTHDEAVKAVLSGIRRTIGTAVTRKAPATDDILRAMLKRVPDTLRGKRDRALLIFCFSAACRRSEIVAIRVEDLERVPEGVIVLIRRSKTDQEAKGQPIPVLNGRKLRPVEALDTWLAAAGITTGPVFRAIGKGDRVGAEELGDQSVAHIVKRYAAAAKLDPTLYAGHSLRAGLVTTALKHGVDVLKIMDITRHRSVETLKGYDRRSKLFADHAGKKFL